MGLDVYLTKCPNRAICSQIEAEYEKRSEAIWDFDGRKYEDLTDEDKHKARDECKATALALGLDEHGEHPDKQTIKMDDPRFPDHYFKVGYFRSSYNDGGINRVLGRANVPDLYAIFEPGDQYEVVPDWEACLTRCDEAIAAWKAHLESDMGRFECFSHGINIFSSQADFEELPKDENAALATFKRHFETFKNREEGSWYSNCDGMFMPQGVKCFAIIPGMKYNTPTSFVVYERDGDESPDDNWYYKALLITKATIEHVLAQPDKADYYLRWSG